MGIFLTYPKAFDESTHARTIASSSSRVIYDIAKKSSLFVSSNEVAILLTSNGLELRFNI